MFLEWRKIGSVFSLKIGLASFITLSPLGFPPLWFEPRSGHVEFSQVLLMDGQVVFPRVLCFSSTFNE